MSEKRRLGKGLGALIPEVMSSSNETSAVSIDLIQTNPYQPRRDFEDDKLEELAASIKKHGILQPVVITEIKGREDYFLVAGERRCRAAKMAGLKEIPVVIKKIEKETMLEIALVENLQREDLNPVEEALAYKKLMKELGYTQEEIAQKLGKSRPAVTNSIRLLSLTEPVLKLLRRGVITAGQARPLLTIEDPLQQQEIARRIVKEGMTARDAEKITSEADKKPKKKAQKDDGETSDPLKNEIQLQIQRNLGTKVRIKQGKSGGTIEIYYYSEDDLERLVSKLLPEGI